MDLLRVKAHDVGAFAASKAFYGGVSTEQILQACHLKPQYFQALLPQRPPRADSKGPFLPLTIFRGCPASDCSSLMSVPDPP